MSLEFNVALVMIFFEKNPPLPPTEKWMGEQQSNCMSDSSFSG